MASYQLYLSILCGLATTACARSVRSEVTSIDDPVGRCQVVTGNSDYCLYSYGDCAQISDGPCGEFSVTWEDGCNFAVGKGWNPGSSQPIIYSGSYGTDGFSYLAVYGWTLNPLVEYFIVENYGAFNPSTGSAHMGVVSTDGSVYNVYKMTRVNQPSIEGTATFQRYLSVRQDKRSSGTVTLANHFNAWARFGMPMGSEFDYQVFGITGYGEGGGSADITVFHGDGGSCSV